MATAVVIIGELTPVNFVSHSGDQFVIQATTKDLAGSIVDITGAIIKFGLYDRITHAEILTKEVASGIVITDGPNGRYDVTVDAADSVALVDRYNHETEMTLGGIPRTVMEGYVNFKLDRVNA